MAAYITARSWDTSTSNQVWKCDDTLLEICYVSQIPVTTERFELQTSYIQCSSLNSGLCNWMVCKMFAVQNLPWLPEFVIHNMSWAQRHTSYRTVINTYVIQPILRTMTLVTETLIFEESTSSWVNIRLFKIKFKKNQLRSNIALHQKNQIWNL